MGNIQNISDSYLCSGCGTCNAVCPHDAVTMRKTPTMGLLYANVECNKCADCGLCLKMCPSRNSIEEKQSLTPEQIIGSVKACYIGRSLDKDVFANAQSGGMVTTILFYLFSNNLIDAAVSCRMDYGYSVPRVSYSIHTSAKDLLQCQKSCYTQVDIVSALKDTSSYGRVAVVGTACQIRGVSNLMALKKFGNIKYRIGLICDKTYSDTYMDAIMYGEQRPEGEVRINYRQKNFMHEGNYHSYQQAPTVIYNREGDITVVPNSKRIFLKEYFAVPKCKICWDKLNTYADIVLGDPWGLNGKYDEKEGDSVIIVRTEDSECLIADMLSANLIKLSPVTINEVADGQCIEKRVADIRSFDFSKRQKKWKAAEASTKESILHTCYKKYRDRNKYVLLWKIKQRVIQLIKH